MTNRKRILSVSLVFIIIIVIGLMAYLSIVRYQETTLELQAAKVNAAQLGSQQITNNIEYGLLYDRSCVKILLPGGGSDICKTLPPFATYFTILLIALILSVIFWVILRKK